MDGGAAGGASAGVASPLTDERAETAGAGALPVPGTAAAGVAPRGRLPFAARFQAILIGVMFVGFALILQQSSKTLYQIGLPLLVLTAFLQIAFGNIPPTAGFRRSMTLLGVTWVIVAAVFGLGIVLAPTLIDLGKGG